MSFEAKKFTTLGAQAKAGIAYQKFGYLGNIDSFATISADGYFDNTKEVFTKGDIIEVLDKRSSPNVIRYLIITAKPLGGSIKAAEIQVGASIIDDTVISLTKTWSSSKLTDVIPVVSDIVIVKSVDDFPALEMAGDGNMRYPLGNALYVIYNDLVLTNGFTLNSSTDPTKFVPTELIAARTGVVIAYLGSAGVPLFYGRNVSAFGLRGLQFFGGILPTLSVVPFADIEHNGLAQVTLTLINNCLVANFSDLGRIDNGRIILDVAIFQIYQVGFKFNSTIAEGITISGTIFINPAPFAATCMSFSGVYSLIKIIGSEFGLGNNNEAIYLDDELTYSNIEVNSNPFSDALGANFVKPNTSQAIVSFADSVANPGVDTTVEVTAHDFIQFQTITQKGTTNYNDQFSIVRIVDANHYDINIAFAGDDAAGTAVATSLDQTSLNINFQNNGSQAKSTVTAKMSFEGNALVTTISVADAPTPINSLFTDGSIEERMIFQDLCTFDGTADVITTLFNHGMSDGDEICFVEGGGLPTGITAGTKYFIVNSAATTFQIEEQIDKGIVDFTGNGTPDNYYRHSTGEGLGNIIYVGSKSVSLGVYGWGTMKTGSGVVKDARISIMKIDSSFNFTKQASGSRSGISSVRSAASFVTDIVQLSTNEGIALYVENNTDTTNITVSDLFVNMRA